MVDVWVTGQLLAAAGEDGWWRRISLSLSADFLMADFCWLICCVCGGICKKYWLPQCPFYLRRK
jgi:hypothetical protein